MIKYIKRIDLDIVKYNTCIDSALNSRIYAHSWYLDIVAANWDALVLDDYAAVMPLPWRQKYFIKYIYKPCWTQQLGVFSTDSIDEVLVKEFIKAIPRKFRKITLQLNSENPISGKGVTKKINYILPLNGEYKELFKEFNRSRKRRCNRALLENFSIEKIDFHSFIKIVKKHYPFLKSTNEDYFKLQVLMSKLSENRLGKAHGIKCLDEEILGASIILNDENRITYLFGVVTPEGKNMQAMSFFINNIIMSNSGTSLIIDFEGSMEKGIADFYKSFGAIKEVYKVYHKEFTLL